MNAVLNTDPKNRSFTFDLVNADMNQAEHFISWFRKLIVSYSFALAGVDIGENNLNFDVLLSCLIVSVYSISDEPVTWSIKAWTDFDVTEINYKITVSTHSLPFCLQERIKKLNIVKE